MLAVLGLAVVLANIAQPFPAIAPLQHAPTVALILAAPRLLRRWPLSNGAVGCLLAFFLLHTLGGRWTYSNVPYDDWARAISGHTISAAFGWTRNNYDRLVHLAFGALFVPPVAELTRRHGGLGARCALAIAVGFVFAVGAFYEIFEWWLTIVAGGMADDYNGQQGDLWDAQKDMGIAGLGALAAAGVEAVIAICYRGSHGTGADPQSR